MLAGSWIPGSTLQDLEMILSPKKTNRWNVVPKLEALVAGMCGHWKFHRICNFLSIFRVENPIILISLFTYSYGTPQSLPAFQHPSHALLKDNNFTQLQYSKYHSRCLKGKNHILFRHSGRALEFKISCIPYGLASYSIDCISISPFRTEEIGHWSITGNEYPF